MNVPTLTPAYLNIGDPMILAHRGDSAHAPANTLPAFAMAVDHGADALETDVHWTKDGVVVVMHDDTIDAVSDGTGRVEDYTYQELLRFDFGYQFTRDKGVTFPFRGCGVRIPTLEEVLRNFPRVRVNIDLKPREPKSIRAFLKVVYDCGAQERVLAASFHHRVLERFRAMNSDIPTSASMRETAEFVFRNLVRVTKRTYPYCALQVPLEAYGMRVVTPSFIRSAHRAGLAVHAWTVDNPTEMQRLLHLGIDGIVTNDPSVGVAQRRVFLQSSTA